MKLFFCIVALIGSLYSFADENHFLSDTAGVKLSDKELQIIPFRLIAPPIGYRPDYIDLDNDGDPDIIKSVTFNNTPVMWIDDDDDMSYDDFEGDIDNDCLLIDRNKDGHYGMLGDLIIDWGDNNGDQQADMQVIAEYPEAEKDEVWPYGHYMWVLDTDKDQVFNYIDWRSFQLKAWEFTGISDFFEDYSGQSLFLKVHAATNRIDDLRMNWENPFLFYDEDNDNLTEMAIRLVDTPIYLDDKNNRETMTFDGKIDWVSIAIDMDNDNRTGNEFDFDLSIRFRGEGFDYRNMLHDISNFNGLSETDTFFLDPRFRHLTELMYPDHIQAKEMILNEGKWNEVYFVYDEDDDCSRWERVEFLEPLDPFKTGSFKGGLDNHPQSDISGDRGEWDMDNSGNGKLYISKFDGRLHLYGAEWGCWRIDQTAKFYQGFDRTWQNKTPENFPTIKYSDVDKNGFIDLVEYDLDGDQIFEDKLDLKSLDLSDENPLVDISNFEYSDYLELQKKIADSLWKNAQKAIKTAEFLGVNTTWYAKLKQARTVREKYHNGYWLQLYIFKDLQYLCKRNNDMDMLRKVKVAYLTSDWESLIK